MHCDTCTHKGRHAHKTSTKTMKYSYNVRESTEQDQEREIRKRVITDRALGPNRPSCTVGTTVPPRR